GFGRVTPLRKPQKTRSAATRHGGRSLLHVSWPEDSAQSGNSLLCQIRKSPYRDPLPTGKHRVFRSAHRARRGRHRRASLQWPALAKLLAAATGLTISTSTWTATTGATDRSAKVGFSLELPDEGGVDRRVERSRVRDGQFDAEARRDSREGSEIDAGREVDLGPAAQPGGVLALGALGPIHRRQFKQRREPPRRAVAEGQARPELLPVPTVDVGVDIPPAGDLPQEVEGAEGDASGQEGLHPGLAPKPAPLGATRHPELEPDRDEGAMLD